MAHVSRFHQRQQLPPAILYNVAVNSNYCSY